jgi:fucokinase
MRPLASAAISAPVLRGGASIRECEALPRHSQMDRPQLIRRPCEGSVRRIIVVTCSTEAQAEAVEGELQRRTDTLEPGDAFLAVADPEGVRLGSGGATLNALVVACDVLEADQEVDFASLLVIVVHSGGDSQRLPLQSVCGKAWSLLPSRRSGTLPLAAPIDLLLQCLGRMFSRTLGGLVVACSDVLLLLPPERPAPRWEPSGVTGFAVPAPSSIGPNHGVYVVSGSAAGTCPVESFLQKASEADLETSGAIDSVGNVWIDTGVVFFAPDILRSMLVLSRSAILGSCTYLALDRGKTCRRVELYSDMLLCLSKGLEYAEYVGEDPAVADLRGAMWREWREFPFSVALEPEGTFTHIGTTLEYRASLTEPLRASEHFQFERQAHCCCTVALPSKSCVLNSIVKGEDGGMVHPGSVVEHSLLQGAFSIGEGSILSGLRATPHVSTAPHTTTQEFSLQSSDRCITVLGVDDPIKSQWQHASARFLGRPWAEFFSAMGADPEDVWPGVPTARRTLWNALAFRVEDAAAPWGASAAAWMHSFASGSLPESLKGWKESKRLSLQLLLTRASAAREFAWRSSLAEDVATALVCGTLASSSLQPIDGMVAFLAAQRLGGASLERVLTQLDQVLEHASWDVGARCLQVQALLVWQCAGWDPQRLLAANNFHRDFHRAFDLLEVAPLPECVTALRAARRTWLASPHRMLRLGHQLERASSVLIKRCVQSAKVSTTPSTEDVGDRTVEMRCPVRLDLAGGWTDTPPVCFEAGTPGAVGGGYVVNVGVLIDRAAPLGCHCRRSSLPGVEIHSRATLTGAEFRVKCDSISDFFDFHDPERPGSLVKCALVCLGYVDLTSAEPLPEQLASHFHGSPGLVVASWSNVSQGSGLGVSSILAAAVLRGIARCANETLSNESLTHAVLLLEQMLSTGGGYQDQVGGLWGGVQSSRTRAGLPVEVVVEPVRGVDLEEFSRRLVIVPLGQPRLAKNLLQQVLRRWACRSELVSGAVTGLVENAERMTAALTASDWKTVGACLDEYWKQKVVMASEAAETARIREVRKALEPLSFGSCVCGAGGGGHLTAVLRDGVSVDHVRTALGEAFEGVSVHSVQVDTTGMSLTLA